jgi:hypothetical protein
LHAQEACPKAGRHWRGSGGFLAVLHAQQRLAASVTREHELLRQANLTFRRVRCLFWLPALPAPEQRLPGPLPPAPQPVLPAKSYFLKERITGNSTPCMRQQCCVARAGCC